MKKTIITALSLLLCLLVFFACDNGKIPEGGKDKNNGGVLVPDVPVIPEAPNEPSVPDEPSAPNTGIETHPTPDSELDTGLDTDVETGNDFDTSGKEDTPLVPDPKPETPTPPINFKYTLARDGVAEYTIVYDDSDEIISTLTLSLAEELKNTYGIEFSLSKKSDNVRFGKEIVVGDFRNTIAIKNEMAKTDFAVSINGDDLFLIATGSRMYYYLFDVLRTEILTSIKDGDWFFYTNDAYFLSKSEHSEESYLEYLNNGSSKITAELMEKIFEYRTVTSQDGTTLPYRLYVPYDYTTKQDYPVLIFLHGAGERGSDNKSQLKNMMLDMLKQENSPLLNSIIIAPQCPSGQQWVDTPWENGSYKTKYVEESNELKAVIEILDITEEKYSTDTQRYYLAGLSMGGFGVWDLAMRHTERWAGVLALCGGADPSMAQKLVELPIYALHSSNDNIVPYEGTCEIVNAIKQAGGTKIEFETRATSHNVWGYAGASTEIIAWLFSQRKQ